MKQATAYMAKLPPMEIVGLFEYNEPRPIGIAYKRLERSKIQVQNIKEISLHDCEHQIANIDFMYGLN